jgi:hypothetical protein
MSICPICGKKAYIGFNMVECKTPSCQNFRKEKISISMKGDIYITWDRNIDTFILPGGTTVLLKSVPQSGTWSRKVPTGVHAAGVTWRDVVDWVRATGAKKVIVIGDWTRSWPNNNEPSIDQFEQECKKIWPEGWMS